MIGLRVCLVGKVLVMGNDSGAGKGDRYRKLDQQKWDEGWERSFGKKSKMKQKKKTQNNKEKSDGSK